MSYGVTNRLWLKHMYNSGFQMLSSTTDEFPYFMVQSLILHAPLLHFTAYDVSLLIDLEKLPADESGKGDDYCSVLYKS